MRPVLTRERNPRTAVREARRLRVQRDEAYVLRTQELGEHDVIVTLFAREHGRIRGVARAARRSRKRFGGLLEPLTHVRLIWAERTSSDLHRIESMDCVRTYASMQSDPMVQAACAILCELAEALAREGQADDRAFKLIGAVARALEGGCDVWSAVRYAEYWLLRIHGLLPDLESCSACGRSLGGRGVARVDRDGAVRCKACAESFAGRQWGLGGAERMLLEDMRRHGPSELCVAARSVRPGGSLEALLRGTLEGFVERRFRSYRHLAALTAAGGEERRS
jgi:DNA repair protein RecO (recombination protein O)